MLNRPPQRFREGFTLAELLVVIALIGIMFAIAVPALVDITKQTKLDAAANAVHSACKMARQHALTQAQPTYVVFNEGQTDAALAYQAYAVFTINIHTNMGAGGILPVDAGYFLTNWEVLPSGVVFDNVSGLQGEENVFYSTGAAWNGAIGKNNRLDIQGSTYTVHGYRPNGEAGTTTHWIYLAEALMINGQPSVTGQQGKQIRFGMTGRSRILDTIYTNGEAEVLEKK
jgi:prepilin-type N-terminal cleavage/methylation domain-containing protein